MRLARATAKLAIGGVLAGALMMVGGTAAMAQESPNSKSGVTQSIEMTTDAVVAKATNDVTAFALDCGENPVNPLPGSVFNLTH